MKLVKESGGLKFFQKRSGRYAVQDGEGQWVHGVGKVKALVAAGLIKAHIPEKEAPVVVPVVASDEPTEEPTEEVA